MLLNLSLMSLNLLEVRLYFAYESTSFKALTPKRCTIQATPRVAPSMVHSLASLPLSLLPCISQSEISQLIHNCISAFTPKSATDATTSVAAANHAAAVAPA